jgi:hypothetical protein
MHAKSFTNAPRIMVKQMHCHFGSFFKEEGAFLSYPTRGLASKEVIAYYVTEKTTKSWTITV